MKYEVIIKPRAEKELLDLNQKDYERVRLKIGELAGNPRPFGVKQLKTRENYRIRVGNYRVIYNVGDKQKIVEILDVLRRNERTYQGL
ncbi:MAG: type II toxin-antitoxin system RelE/ParE family toxin [Dehalococcoidales bacterium]